MSIKDRINVLVQFDFLSQEEAEKLICWVAMLNETFGLNISEENGGTLITHLASMLKRSKGNETITAMDPSIYDQLRELSVFEKALQLYSQLNISFNIPKEEEDYVMLHLCNLLQQEESYE